MANLEKRIQAFGEHGAAKELAEAKAAPFTNSSSTHQRFIARVVLHRTDGNDEYTELHEAMDDLGFSRFITGTNTKSNASESHKLPNGLYYQDRGYTLNPFNQHQRLQEAYEQIAKVIKGVVDKNPAMYKANTPPSIFVAEASMALWSGLNPAPEK